MDTELGRIRFSGAIIIATTLKVVAALVLFGGVALAIAVAGEATNSDPVVETVSAILGSAITSAALLATAGFVLEILVDSYSELADIQINMELMVDNASPDDEAS